MSDVNEKVLIFAFRELRIDRKRTTEGKRRWTSDFIVVVAVNLYNPYANT